MILNFLQIKWISLLHKTLQFISQNNFLFKYLKNIDPEEIDEKYTRLASISLAIMMAAPLSKAGELSRLYELFLAEQNKFIHDNPPIINIEDLR